MQSEVSENFYKTIFPEQEWVLGSIFEKRAAQYPDHQFFFFEGRWYTYAEINAGANRVLEGLKKQGVCAGDRVALLMNGSPEYFYVWIALAKLGAVEVPINTAYKGPLLVHVLVDTGARLVISDAEFLEAVLDVANECPDLSLCVVNSPNNYIPELEMDAVSLAELSVGDGENPCDGPSYTDLACIMFTSGTTGPSKGVMLCHHFQWSFGVHFAEIIEIKEADVVYNFLPFFHIAGKFVAMAVILLNAKMILRTKFSATSFWSDVRAHSVTKSAAVGGVCHMLYSFPQKPDDAQNTLELLYATPVPTEIQTKFEERFDLLFVEAFGSTEMNLIAFSKPGATPRGSFGKAGAEFDIKIFDENDIECPVGVSGEIVVRSRSAYMITHGYYNLPEKTLEAFRNLWFHSGDKGYQDEDGWLYFQDRLSDSMRRRGENISSYEIERVVNAHDCVVESAAIAVPSELQEDEIKLVVVKNSESILSEYDVLEYCAQNLPYFMVPRYIEFIKELPRTPLTKIRKSVLRETGITEGTWDCEAHGIKVFRDGIIMPQTGLSKKTT